MAVKRKRWPSLFSPTVWALAALAVASFGVLVTGNTKVRYGIKPIDDAYSLRVLTGWLITEGFPLDETGKLDVYALYRGPIELEERTARLCFSLRSNRGPSLEQIREGDYAQFPWIRRVGRPTFEAIVPMMWEPYGDARLVSFSDGSVRVLDAAEFAAIEPQAAER